MSSENHREHRGAQRKIMALCEPLHTLWLIFFSMTHFQNKLKSIINRITKIIFYFRMFKDVGGAAAIARISSKTPPKPESHKHLL